MGGHAAGVANTQDSREIVRALHRIELALLKLLRPLNRLAEAAAAGDKRAELDERTESDTEDRIGEEIAQYQSNERPAIPVLRLGGGD